MNKISTTLGVNGFLRNRRNFVFAAAIFAVCFIFNASSVSAATFVVNSMADVNDVAAGNGVCETAAGNGVCTLRAAITEANALAGDDIITLPAGTYTNTITGANDTNAGGDLDIRSNITINGAGSGTTIIQANAAAGVATERVLDFPIAGTSIINDVTIRNGRQTATFGGGVRLNVDAAVVTFNNCVISNNVGVSGGGGLMVFAATASATLNNTTFTANSSTTRGSAITSIGIVNLNNSTVSNNTVTTTGTISASPAIDNGGAAAVLTLTNSIVSGNTSSATGTGNSFGGGVGTFGIINITGSTISNNTSTAATGAGFAGGIAIQDATLTLTNSTVSGNTASSFHAGIRALAANAPTTVTINRSAIVNNTAVLEGGGLVNFSVGAFNATMNINNSTVGGNMTTGNGGGIENLITSTGSAITNVNYSTVAGNMANTDNTGADVGGGIANINSGGTGTGALTVNLQSSIVADNTIGTNGTGPDIFGVITSADYNHVEDLTGGTFTAMANDVTGVDPQLMALSTTNGSPTANYQPAPTSPVIDTIPAGVNGCGVAPFNIDQRGVLRPTDSDMNGTALCEKGAVERLGPTAASVTISGNVQSGRGRGISGVVVMMTDSFGTTRTARTNQFGYYRFDDVEAGETYILNAFSKRYQFDSKVVSISEELTNLDFIPQK